MAYDWDRQFEIASEKVRDLARRCLSEEMSGADFKREIGCLNADELAELTALLLNAPLHGKEEDAADSDGPLPVEK